MKYEFLSGYCTQKPGATKDFQAEWQAYRYFVGGKMFLMEGGDKEETPIITLKLEPLKGELLRKQYPGIVIPGHYMNKVHWNSIYRHGDVPDELVKECIDESYRLIFSALTKKTQVEILNS
ncbi:MmcQ/YjbR family DNA-binding protein [Christensenellaceae bacterium OttesenSCG-928-M15]|nr:MmcQ/YjbR family DNA-binding protein [Christensenellaceae bacterium OttesenSCG-928-M15]